MEKLSRRFSHGFSLAKNITLPTSTANFDGSTSTDDVKVVSYVWELLSAPAGYQANLPSSINITMTNLIAGNYVIQLTVTDELGLSDTTTASLTATQPVGTLVEQNTNSF